MTLKIILWNCRGFKSKKNELTKRVQEYEIIVLTETKCKDEQHNMIYFSEYKTYTLDSTGNSGGLSISVKKNIEFKILQQWEDIGNEIDIVGIRTRNFKKNFNIVAVYKRPGKVLSMNKWKEIFEFDNSQLETIFLGDFNAHNTAWNCQDTDENGDRLWLTTYNKGLICLNQETESRMGDTGQSSSNIDLIFGTTEMVNITECE